jgi:hypothetical protein
MPERRYKLAQTTAGDPVFTNGAFKYWLEATPGRGWQLDSPPYESESARQRKAERVKAQTGADIVWVEGGEYKAVSIVGV